MSLLNKILRKIEYELIKLQDLRGYFHTPLHNGNICISVFDNSLILLNLKDYPLILPTIKEKLRTILYKELSQNLTLNYFFRNSREFSTYNFPDDLDDTFLTIRALNYFPKHLPVYLKLLNRFALRESGFNTWVVDDLEKFQEWKCCDTVVTSNVIAVLSSFGIHYPFVESWLDHLIISRNLTSKYYDKSLLGLYFIFQYGISRPPSVRNLLNQVTLESLRNYKNLAMTDRIILGILLIQQSLHHNSLYSELIRASWNLLLQNLEDDLYVFKKSKDSTFYVRNKAVTLSFLYKFIYELNTLFLSEKIQRKTTHWSINKNIVNSKINSTQSIINKDCVVLDYSTSCRKVLKLNPTLTSLFLMPTSFLKDFILEFGYIYDARLVDELSLLNVTGWELFSNLDNLIDNPKAPSINVDKLFLCLHSFLKSHALLGKTYLTKRGLKFYNHLLYKCMKDLKNEKAAKTSFTPLQKLLIRGNFFSLGLKLLVIMTFKDNHEVNRRFFACLNILVMQKQLYDDSKDYFFDYKTGNTNYFIDKSIRVKDNTSYWREVVPVCTSVSRNLAASFDTSLLWLEKKLGIRLSYLRYLNEPYKQKIYEGIHHLNNLKALTNSYSEL